MKYMWVCVWNKMYWQLSFHAEYNFLGSECLTQKSKIIYAIDPTPND